MIQMVLKTENLDQPMKEMYEREIIRLERIIKGKNLVKEKLANIEKKKR